MTSNAVNKCLSLFYQQLEFNCLGLPNFKMLIKISTFVSSASFLPTGDIIVVDMYNNRLKLFNCFFEYINHLTFRTAPQYVCCSQNYPVAYVSFQDKVRQFHVQNGILIRSGFIKLNGICKGIGINRYDGKAVSLSLSDMEGAVALLTPGGNIQEEFRRDSLGKNLFISPEYLTITKNLKIVVADKGTQSVLGLHSDGEILFRYKGVRQPTGICCDEQGYIYVGSQLSIHQINEQGELIKLFLSKAEIGFSPLCLSYSFKDNLLLVTGKGDRVSLFKLST